MAIEKLKQISEAENEAVSIRRQAQSEARKITDTAKQQAQQLLAEAAVTADDGYRKVVRAAEDEAQKAYETKLLEVRSECKALKEEASTRVPEAVRAIMGKVVNNSGDR